MFNYTIVVLHKLYLMIYKDISNNKKKNKNEKKREEIKPEE